MNTLQSTATSAVVTRLHDAGRRAAARGAGRTRSSHVVAIDANTYQLPVAVPAARGAAPAERPEDKRLSATAEAEFTAYVRERRAALYATAYHLTGDRYEAEDLLQSALFSTYRAWDRITDKAAVGGYLRRTMTNLHISAWRRRKLNEYPTEELPETVGETDAMRGTELRAVLWQALAKLPEPQRTMLVLRYYEGRTDPEIAEILDISVGTVKSSIWRSLRRLRDDESLSFGESEAESFGELVA
ncbi:SigE family RNA polymerase sigma factor [Streptomyces sp. NPDC093225]|uniref:SigE family RNA polymerase sigma factor n=1 Tax=Streptomyces sp. NPDC093225 TaxID=3366034 RepID=UPI003825F84C